MAAKRRRRTKHSRRDPFARERAIDAINRMRRDGVSLTQAARTAHTTRTTVLRHAKSALRKKGTRYAVTASDRLVRHVRFLTDAGRIEISVRGSRTASEIARHMAAVDRYLGSGDIGPLSEFEGRSVRAGRETFPFLTDPDALVRLANAGEVSFERLYSRR